MKVRTLGTVAVAIAAMVAALSAPSSATSASNAEASPETSQITVTVSGAGITVQQLTCDVTVDNPHYSRGAPGVIAKVRYSCFGNMSGTLGVHANLYKFASGTVGPYVPKASNSESRPVFPGAKSTVYVPAASLPGIACNLSHLYYADAFISLSAGPSSGTGYVKSSTAPPPFCP